ncbi:transposase domain-containing protein [Streptomyces kaempferi]|uniref:Transposase domain-containing protein n=1 Tax=Streptomyces kaempferi TaxID=333725 RepID=A0ABW3XNI3_9ACTN
MATGLPVGQKIDQDPTVCKGAPLGAQPAIAAASIVMSTPRPVSPRSRRRLLEPQFGDRIRLGVLTEEITPEVVDEVLGLTGRAERRRRLLPAHAVVYFVLCACSAAPTAQGRRDTGWSCGP